MGCFPKTVFSSVDDDGNEEAVIAQLALRRYPPGSISFSSFYSTNRHNLAFGRLTKRWNVKYGQLKLPIKGLSNLLYFPRAIVINDSLRHRKMVAYNASKHILKSRHR